MDRKFMHVLIAALTVHVISARVMCPSHPNCVCGGTFAIELNCNIDGRIVKINSLPSTYVNIKCENTTTLDYSQLPKYANETSTFKSVTFKDCPLPNTSFKDILMQIGVSKTMSLIFQNEKDLSGLLDRKHFAGLHDLTKLLLSVNGITNFPDNLFMDVHNLTWLNIRCNNIRLSEELFKPLEKLETLEISHNHMTNISSNLFSHLSLLRKLSLWQSNVTRFSNDFFTGVDVLEELDLSSNGLNELPATIFKPLRNLKKLTLFSNKFSKLPQNLFSTNNKLETVIILNNDVKIKELPKNLFGNLPNLKQVYVQRSGIEVIPSDTFTNSSLITNISLAFNDIAEIPELTFNDQINLLELDLSHNKLKSLESKLFSSLVRLENLNLCYNSIEEVTGSTFSSLLSLIYLNMEHNKLKTISSYLFSNNKQRMSISLAHNMLTFVNEDIHNNSWAVNKFSPFAHTYNLKMLNLSHNRFYTTFEDWWINGHEIVDVSYNSLRYLWGDGKSFLRADETPAYEKVFKKPVKEIRLVDNPLDCRCINFRFIQFVKHTFTTKVMDNTLENCSIWLQQVCFINFIMLLTALTTILTVILILYILCLPFKPVCYSLIKNTLYYILHHNKRHVLEKHMILKYCESDQEFVLKELLAELNDQKNYDVHSKCISNGQRESFIKHFAMGTKESTIILVIFSQNYLTTAYSQVSIKKIRGEMLKAKNTIYIFVDNGNENSVYAFLKEQRDPRSTVLWSDPDFWSTLIYMITNSTYKKKVWIAPEYDKGYIDYDTPTTPSPRKDEMMGNKQFARHPEWPMIYTSSTFERIQV